MNPEILNIILTVITIMVIVILLIITYKYTRATELIAELEKEKKEWDVIPILVPFNKVNENKNFYGIKNIGRGVATINYLEINPTRGNDHYSKNRREYSLPIYLGIGEEFIYTHIEIEDKLKFKEQIIKVKYSDIHGNLYYTDFEEGAIKRGKL